MSLLTHALPVMVGLVIPAISHAQYLFETNNGALTIVLYTGPGGAVTVPDATNGMPVTSIGDYAFYNCYTLNSLTIPVSITNIGNYAFQGCLWLTNAALPDSVTALGYSAFAQTALLGIALPQNLTELNPGLFYYCTNLTSVALPDGLISGDSRAGGYRL